MYTCKYLDDLRTFCFILFFVYLFVYFFSFFFFTNDKSIRGEELENDFFSWTHSSWRFFQWFPLEMYINGSKKFQLLTHANRILFFLVLQFIKGICSFFFYFFFSLFHSIDQHVQRDIELPNNGDSRCCYILPVHAPRRIWSIDILMKYPRSDIDFILRLNGMYLPYSNQNLIYIPSTFPFCSLTHFPSRFEVKNFEENYFYFCSCYRYIKLNLYAVHLHYKIIYPR